jgi:hypothetical protein
MHRTATLNSWLRTNNDIVFNCDRDDLTGQLITTIITGDPREKLGKVLQLGTISLSDRIVKITTRNLISEVNKVIPSNNKELVSLLKSHLQKCIRRGKSDLAVKTASHLLDLDAVNLLRRLPIIIPEDVMILPHFDATVWLMMAYPFRGLTNEDKTWVLGSVKRLADFEWVDTLYEEAPDGWMPDQEDDKIGAIALRHAFGGTRSDMDLLRHVAYTWKQRYSEKSKVGEFAKKLQSVTRCIVQIPLDTVKPLERSEFLLAAVDHHVTPITSLLPKSILNPRQMIWDCSSSINFRTRLDFSKKDKPYWSQEDKKHIIDAQERLLDRMFPDEGIPVNVK